jgi:precorrin isomerase
MADWWAWWRETRPTVMTRIIRRIRHATVSVSFNLILRFRNQLPIAKPPMFEVAIG